MGRLFLGVEIRYQADVSFLDVLWVVLALRISLGGHIAMRRAANLFVDRRPNFFDRQNRADAVECWNVLLDPYAFRLAQFAHPCR